MLRVRARVRVRVRAMGRALVRLRVGARLRNLCLIYQDDGAGLGQG